MTNGRESGPERSEQFERILRKSEERFRRVVEHAPNAIVMVNAAGLIEMVNAQAERVFGYSRDELVGRPVEILVPAHSRRHHPDLRAAFFTTPLSRPMGAGRDLFAVRKDGSEFPVEIGLNPIETEDGTMVLSAIVDISARKRLEERFRRTIEFAPMAMVMTGPAGLIEMVNAQAEAVFGYSRSELLGKPVEMLVPERFRTHHPDLRTAFFADAQSRPMGAGRDLYGRRKDGTEFPVEIGLNPIPTEDGTMVLSSITDISDRKLKEERLRAALDEKNVLFREVHHRVKNNLQVLSSLLDLQMGTVVDTGAMEILRECRDRVHSMALVHQHLYQSSDLARIDGAAFLNTLVGAVVASYEAETERISVSVDAEPVPLPLETAIPCGLIVNELVSNACKHGFPGRRPGRIAVTLAKEGDSLALAVSDDGVGIPAAVAVDVPDTLGLQIVTLLSGQIGGVLAVNRVQPTRFSICFPLQ